MEDRSLEDLIKAGNKAQIEKLESHIYKHGIGNLGIAYLFGKIAKQFIKLRNEACYEKEMYYEKQFYLKKNFKYRITRGIAANISNYAHMMILECDQQIETEDKQESWS